jgi:hypothetical protein
MRLDLACVDFSLDPADVQVLERVVVIGREGLFGC